MIKEEFDKTEILPCGTLIQHGQYNNRVYLMKPGQEIATDLPEKLIQMAKENGYTKIFIKIPVDMAEVFFLAGFYVEATVPYFYNGEETGLFMAYCLCSSRLKEENEETYRKNARIAFEKKDNPPHPLAEKKFQIRPCHESDVKVMAGIYKEVFPSYPFPIHNPEYLLETMHDNVNYYCVESNGEIAALSSAEMDISNANVEMTDFATPQKWRGNGFAVHLLQKMEADLKKSSIKMAYTIARAASPGMNITFAKLGYIFGGRLKNNTHISGEIESMNVWYKPL
jgi:putative beta-lysine N-acetyltransferase